MISNFKMKMFLQTQLVKNSAVFLLGIDMGTQFVGFSKANLKDKKLEAYFFEKF